MDNPDNNAGSPSPEVLHPATVETDKAEVAEKPSISPAIKSRRATYRPSHRATIVGFIVVAVILAAISAGIFFIIRGQGGLGAAFSRETVTISAETLEGLGVSRNQVSTQGAELTVGPDSKFNGKVKIGGDVSIAGQLQLNNTFTASGANFTRLQAGETTLGQLNLNGDATASTLNLRNDLNVAGTARIQGPTIMSQLLTVNNSLNVTGNVAIGGSLSVRNFQASSLTSETTLTIGGHVITKGNAPGAGAGGAVGSNGTVSISGNDAAGTVAVNIGVGGGNGTLVQVTFNDAYGSTPHVVITPIGVGGNFYVNRSPSGFSIGVNGALSPGGYAFDYIVMQ